MLLWNGIHTVMLKSEDFEYTKWLDPAGVPCYVKDEAEAPDTDEGGRYKL